MNDHSLCGCAALYVGCTQCMGPSPAALRYNLLMINIPERAEPRALVLDPVSQRAVRVVWHLHVKTGIVRVDKDTDHLDNMLMTKTNQQRCFSNASLKATTSIIVIFLQSKQLLIATPA